jgi:hypothetical protein
MTVQIGAFPNTGAHGVQWDCWRFVVIVNSQLLGFHLGHFQNFSIHFHAWDLAMVIVKAMAAEVAVTGTHTVDSFRFERLNLLPHGHRGGPRAA